LNREFEYEWGENHRIIWDFTHGAEMRIGEFWRMEKKFDLDERLIRFAAGIIGIAQTIPSTAAAMHLANQLIRSGTSPALNHAEALGAESIADFIHKMKIALKELRETYTCLRIIRPQNRIAEDKLAPLIDENNQLIAIVVTCIKTAHLKRIAASHKRSQPPPQ